MRKRYDNEYKRYICRLVIEENHIMKDLAVQIGVNPTTISRWVRDYNENAGWAKKYEQAREEEVQREIQRNSYILPQELIDENKQLKKDKARLEREMEILKKAMHVFTENHV